MDCHWMREKLPSYADGELGALPRALAQFHLATCSSCFERYDRLARSSSPAARLIPVQPPANLNLRIRLEASRQAQRKSWWVETWTSLKTELRDAMRPFALRALGATFSAALLFGALMPDLWTLRNRGPDVPVTYMARGLVSAPTMIELASYPAVRTETTVLVRVDARGGVYDLEMPADQRDDRKLWSEIANALLFAEFEPAMVFGHPVPGRLLISFTRYTVRG